jgi:cytochrome c
MRAFLNPLLIAGLLFSSQALAASRTDMDAAEALAKKVVADIKSKGADTVYKAINDKSPEYVSEKFYPWCMTNEGKMLAHGANTALLNVPQLDMKDADGKPFVREEIELAKKGGGWITPFKWANPTTKRIETKISFVVPVDANVWCASGVYQ